MSGEMCESLVRECERALFTQRDSRDSLISTFMQDFCDGSRAQTPNSLARVAPPRHRPAVLGILVPANRAASPPFPLAFCPCGTAAVAPTAVAVALLRAAAACNRMRVPRCCTECREERCPAAASHAPATTATGPAAATAAAKVQSRGRCGRVGHKARPPLLEATIARAARRVRPCRSPPVEKVGPARGLAQLWRCDRICTGAEEAMLHSGHHMMRRSVRKASDRRVPPHLAHKVVSRSGGYRKAAMSLTTLLLLLLLQLQLLLHQKPFDQARALAQLLP